MFTVREERGDLTSGNSGEKEVDRRLGSPRALTASGSHSMIGSPGRRPADACARDVLYVSPVRSRRARLAHRVCSMNLD